jgi:hypothetical protein
MREIEGQGPETIAAEFAVVSGYVGLPEKWLLLLPENALHLKAELPRPFSYLLHG